MPDEYLWPVRNVAEHAYCPRLFYLMEVEGLHIASTDTVEGVAIHERVDVPSKVKKKAEDEVEPQDARAPEVVRSLTLTSERFRVTGTLDLAEISGQRAVPVEYRKGRPRTSDRGDEEWWPTERVQLALQAMLLREAGYEVSEGVVYYAATRRRVRMEIDAAMTAEALGELEAAQRLAGEGKRPPPLVNDPRCNGCSLQPICLPDEIHHEQEPQAKSRLPWPPRSEGMVVVVQTEGTKVGVRGGAMRVSDREGNKITEMPLAGIESLALVGNVQISTQAIQTLAGMGVPVAFTSAAGRLLAMIDPLDSVSAEVRKAQALASVDQNRCGELASALVAAKIGNQRTLLMRNGRVTELEREMMAEAGRDAEASRSLESLRGLEGNAARIYFGAFATMLPDEFGKEFDANGRQRRPPPDPVNAVLSMAYTMLSHECVAALRQARLEPTIGVYHVSRPGRPAMALDLMEPFRPLVADSVAISLFSRNEVGMSDFVRTAAGCAMKEGARRAFFSAWQRRMQTEVSHPVYGYRLSYRRMLILHARLIAAWFQGEVSTLSFLVTR